MEKLLDEADITKMKIVNYLLSSPNRYRKIEEIVSTLELSYYTVTTSINNELADDFKNFFSGSQQCSIRRIDEGYQLVGATQNILSVLLWHYGRRARNFHLLDTLLKSNDFSVVKYSKATSLSTSRINKVKKDLRLFLVDYQIDLNYKCQLVGEEYSIRQVLYSTYFSIFKEFERPFPEYVYLEAVNLIQRVASDFSLDYLTEADKNKVLLFLCILVIRLHSGNDLGEKNAYFSPLITQTESSTQSMLMTQFKFSESASMEYQSIKLFLETEQIILYTTSVFHYSVTHSIIALTDSFLHFIRKSDVDVRNRAAIEMVNYGLRDVFKLVTLCSPCRVDDLFYLRREDVQVHYSGQFHLCEKLLRGFLTKEDAQCGKTLKNQSMMLRLVSILTNIFEFTSFQKKVRLRLDFSLGSSYHYELHNWIAHMIDVPIEIVFEPEKAADIVITDRMLEKKRPEEVVYWSYPPTIQDWRLLNEKISKL